MRLLTALLLMTLIGCGTKRLYDGPARAPEEVARLKTIGPRTGWPEAWGEVTRCERFELSAVLATELELLPGEQVCRVKCHVGDRQTDGRLVTFQARAGRSYHPTASESGMSCSVNIVDAGPIGGE